MFHDHELRSSLNDELHGRSGHAVTAPALIVHLAFVLSADDANPLVHLASLCLTKGVKPPLHGALHHIAVIGDVHLRFERHGEFYRLSCWAETKDYKDNPLAALPLDWTEKLPGRRLVAIETRLLAKSKRPFAAKDAIAFFGTEEIAASMVGGEHAMVWTDFRISGSGFTRIIIQNLSMSPIRLGRVIRRIHEIETYRMMALLALPVARDAGQKIAKLEQEMRSFVVEMSSEGDPEKDAAQLEKLSRIARAVEELSNRTSYRFAAAGAYAALVEKRVRELNESRVMNFQRIGVYMERRFSPAMATCTAATRRIEALGVRCERASNLLRTRVDIGLEKQNQLLLQSMEKRATQQLKLQETVEGLSVVAISYYAYALLSKFTEGLHKQWPHFNLEIIHLLLIPAILLIALLVTKRVKKGLKKDTKDTRQAS